tara:strand:+ start:288 stop:617 length:330 start_codon:yes stop_codon:yes gene_type:complete
MRFLLFLLPGVMAQSCGDMRLDYANAGCCTGGDCEVSVPHCDNTSPGMVCYNGTNVIVKGLLEAFGFGPDQYGNDNRILLKKHLIPDANAQHDFGNAEFKIRHLFLSDN